MFEIKQARFVTSVGLNSEFPEQRGHEIAMIGRSNVGKSTLINSICNNYKLAKTSQKPGKTRLINYFHINNDFFLVDLPGYGFANAPKYEQQKWGELIEGYLNLNRVTHIFLLLDIRHPPTQDDKLMFKYILYHSIPFTIIATKADKIAKSKVKASANEVAGMLGAPHVALPYSAQVGHYREALLERIGAIISDLNQNCEQEDVKDSEMQF